MKTQTFRSSMKCALKGIYVSLKSEKNIRRHILATLLVLLSGTVFQLSIKEWLWMIFCCGFVITTEMFNTAIEATVDIITNNTNMQAKKAKDIAAGATLCSAITAFIIGCIIFLPKLILLFKEYTC